jgi:hypothetical protein
LNRGQLTGYPKVRAEHKVPADRQRCARAVPGDQGDLVGVAQTQTGSQTVDERRAQAAPG